MTATLASSSASVVAAADKAPPALRRVRDMMSQERKPVLYHIGLKREREID
jgi:hypothetical protein